jgi:hypothetical protein
VKNREISAERLHNAGWSLGWVGALDLKHELETIADHLYSGGFI